MTIHQLKIETFDKYIMRGGTQSLPNIEELCECGFQMLGVKPDNEEIFDEIVIGTIDKLTQDLT
tara:strand:- start:5273 stop:5464 length:192 start_codon:yes stop_codon:yes gene_type:complete